MRVAAASFDAAFADVEENLRRADALCRQAAQAGVALLVLPEFFTSSMGYSDAMLDVAISSGGVRPAILALAREHGVIVGGSYLHYDGGHAYNRFVLAFPGGEAFEHCKDIPTLVENCYHEPGDTAHILHTPIGDIGIALCWEMARYDTLRRIAGQVDLILAGTCWAALADWDGGAAVKAYNADLALRTPARFARLAGVPMIHANHCGHVTAPDFPNAFSTQTVGMVSAAQVIGADGRTLASRAPQEGAGLVIADLAWGAGKRRPADIPGDAYWIEDLAPAYLHAWTHDNEKGRRYYHDTALPYYQKHYKPITLSSPAL